MEDIHNVTGGFNGNHRGGNSNRGRGGKKRFDKSNVQCYNCQDLTEDSNEFKAKLAR
jgi:hypothetical protein